MLTDARVGLTPADERFADLLRRADKPVILAANKAEGRASEAGVMEAYALGLGDPIPISAEHGEGMSDLFAAIVAASATMEDPEADDQSPDDSGEGEDKPVRIAIIGRPNAGKSTLVNAILGEDRVLTGPEAGITRDAISIDFDWGGRAFRIVDTAGMRRKAKVEGKLEEASVADTIRSIRFADVCVLVMDFAEALEKQDLTIGDLVIREGRALVCVLAKWDKADEPQARLADLRHRMGHTLPQAKGASLVPVSAIADQGLDDLRAAIIEAYRDWNARVKTNDLNRWLKMALERHPPPAVDGKRIKPRYITQIKARPPTFVLMCSRASALPDTYKRYLVNGIREAFDMPGAPIRLFVRQNRNPYAED
jgi:GTP-binding protein